MKWRRWLLLSVVILGALSVLRWFSTLTRLPAPSPPPVTAPPAAVPAPPPTPLTPLTPPPSVVPVPPPVPVPTPNVLSTVDEALDRLIDGNAAFNAPDKAQVDKPFIVEAKLSVRLRRDEIEVLIKEPGKRMVAALKVSDRMAATLSGGSAFDISPDGPQDQWISGKATTDWTWQVTPRRAGEQFLVLSFDAYMTVNGKDDKRVVNTFKHGISVDVSWPATVSEWLEFIKKTGEDISWIWVTLLVPIGGAIWAWIRRRTRSAMSDEADLS